MELGVTKERYKAGDTLRLSYVSADTHAIAEVFQPRSFDLIVTDAPYGVQHGAQSGDALSRKPLDLLASAIPIWRAALRPGGAIGIAWNNLVLRREKLAQMSDRKRPRSAHQPRPRGLRAPRRRLDPTRPHRRPRPVTSISGSHHRYRFGEVARLVDVVALAPSAT